MNARSYELPIRYYDWSGMIMHFRAPTELVRSLIKSTRLSPVQLWPGTSMVAFGAWEYFKSDLAHYREVAVMVPVVLAPNPNIPALPVLLRPWYRGLGYYIVHLPVTTQEACDLGKAVWGFPKVVADITSHRQGGSQICRLRQDGQDVIEIGVRPPLQIRQRMEFFAFPIKDGQILTTLVDTDALWGQRFSGGGWFRLGDHPIAKGLSRLELSTTPMFSLYATRAKSQLHGPSARTPA